MSELDRRNLGFLLAKASQRWNELLYARFKAAGFPEVRAAYGSILVPLFEEDGLRQGELGRRARLSKQTMTTMTRLLERAGLVERRPDPTDARATRIFLTERARGFRPVAEAALRELDALAAGALPEGETAPLRDALERLVELEAGAAPRPRAAQHGRSRKPSQSGRTSATRRSLGLPSDAQTQPRRSGRGP